MRTFIEVLRNVEPVAIPANSTARIFYEEFPRNVRVHRVKIIADRDFAYVFVEGNRYLVSRWPSYNELPEFDCDWPDIGVNRWLEVINNSGNEFKLDVKLIITYSYREDHR